MDFFAQQAKVRRSSRTLVLLFVLAVVAIVAAIDTVVWIAFGARQADLYALSGGTSPSPWPLMLGTSALVVVGIGLASLWRIASLSGGGRKVAEGLGATPVAPEVADPALRRLRNVIEEVAIASGVPVPDIYVLENEPGINAFAAGYSASDAAVCVTRGALDQLDRDELQGVIAHEFSHVLNGDMRLNIRLMGLLFGILVLAVAGRKMLFYGNVRVGRGSRGNGSGQVVAIALVLMVVGYVGYFFARLIQAAVSRSRESLADASAVQFTRQTRGIAGALKKIAITAEGSALAVPNKQEVAHMLFGEAGRFNAWFATHPPLLKRIQALEPGFGVEDLKRHARMAARKAAAAAPPPLPANAAGAVGADGVPGGMPGAVAAFGAAAAGDAGLCCAAVPGTTLSDDLRAAVRQPGSVLAVLIALACTPVPALEAAQRRIVADAFGDDVRAAAWAWRARTAALAPDLWLALTQLAFPALRQLDAVRRTSLLRVLEALVRVDGRVDFHEYCLVRLLAAQLDEAAAPRRAPVDGRRKLPACRASLALVCAVVATEGARAADAARSAWLLAMQHAFPGQPLPWLAPPANWQAAFDRALADLDALVPEAKQIALESVAKVIHADGEVTPAEHALLRVIAASLHSPLAG